MALIANPFISPTLSSIGEKVYDIPNILESNNVKPYKYTDVHLYKMNWPTNLISVNNNE